MDWQAIALSVRLACCTSLILLILGLPLSYWLHGSHSILKSIVETLVALPLVLPPTVLGFYILIVMSPQSYVGQFYLKLTGGVLPFSFSGLLVGSVLYSLPFAVQPFLSGFSSVNPQFIEASWCLGESKVWTGYRVILPLCLPHVLTGLLLSFAHTLGEFGIVLMIGGNIPGVTRTVSVAIFDHVQALEYVAAGKTSLLLLGISFVVLMGVSFLKKRGMYPC